MLGHFFCISIVALHSFPGLINDPNTSELSKSLNSFLRILFLFATPPFIILSEILLSMRYSNGLPKGFFLKRIKFILIPYWIFYFTFGYYFGKNYDYIMNIVKKYIWVLCGLWVLSTLPIFFTYKFMNVTYAQSNRFDIILYTILTFLIVLYVMKVLGKYKLTLLLVISEVSFFVYLSHPLINSYLSRGLASFVEIPILFLILMVMFTLGFSIGIAILLSPFPLSKYLIGSNSFSNMLDKNY